MNHSMVKFLIKNPFIVYFPFLHSNDEISHEISHRLQAILLSTEPVLCVNDLITLAMSLFVS